MAEPKIEKLEIVELGDGRIYKVLNSTHPTININNIQDVYCNFLAANALRSWRVHQQMTCQLVVIKGLIDIVTSTHLIDDLSKLQLGPGLAQRHVLDPGDIMTIPSLVPFYMVGRGEENIVINFSDYPFSERERIKLNWPIEEKFN